MNGNQPGCYGHQPGDLAKWMMVHPDKEIQCSGKLNKKEGVEEGSTLCINLERSLPGHSCWPWLASLSGFELAFLSTWRNGLTNVPSMLGSSRPARLMSWIQNWSCVCTCTSQEPSALRRTSTTSGQVPWLCIHQAAPVCTTQCWAWCHHTLEDVCEGSHLPGWQRRWGFSTVPRILI